MKKRLSVTAHISMEMLDGETKDQAEDRLIEAIYTVGEHVAMSYKSEVETEEE